MGENLENTNIKKTKPNFANWAKEALGKGIITKNKYEAIIEGESLKQDRMKEMGLPYLKNYGFFASIEEIKNKIKLDRNSKFVIRCISKENGRVERLVDINLDECCEFAEKLSGGFEKWKVEIKEAVPTVASGTIVREKDGGTRIESWHGPHYLSEKNPKYIATIDPGRGEIHFDWRAPAGTTDLHEMQKYAIDALRYISPNLKPKTNDPIYLEYGVKKDGEIYFMDAGDPSLKRL